MYFENNYIIFNNNSIINSISSYKILMTKFINKFIQIHRNDYNGNINTLYNDAIIYSKYYVYYKTLNCVYDEQIMNLLYNVDYHLE